MMGNRNNLSSTNRVNHGVNIAFLPLLALVFIILKMTGTVDWPWWVVLSPLVFHGIALAMLVLAVVLGLIAGAFLVVALIGNAVVKRVYGESPLEIEWPESPKPENTLPKKGGKE